MGPMYSRLEYAQTSNAKLPLLLLVLATLSFAFSSGCADPRRAELKARKEALLKELDSTTKKDAEINQRVENTKQRRLAGGAPNPDETGKNLQDAKENFERAKRVQEELTKVLTELGELP